MKRRFLLAALAVGLFLGSAGPALATHCFVADKPDGAGINGAFTNDGAGGPDVFGWDLPEPAHENGSPVHGVLEI